MARIIGGMAAGIKILGMMAETPGRGLKAITGAEVVVEEEEGVVAGIKILGEMAETCGLKTITGMEGEEE